MRTVVLTNRFPTTEPESSVGTLVPCVSEQFNRLGTVDSPMRPPLIIVKWIALKPFPVMERNAFDTNCKVGLAHGF